MKFLRAPFLREHLRWLLSKEKRQGMNKNASKEIYSFSLWDGNKDQADVLESHVKTTEGVENLLIVTNYHLFDKVTTQNEKKFNFNSFDKTIMITWFTANPNKVYKRS